MKLCTKKVQAGTGPVMSRLSMAVTPPFKYKRRLLPYSRASLLRRVRRTTGPPVDPYCPHNYKQALDTPCVASRPDQLRKTFLSRK